MAKGKTVTAFVKLAGMLDPSFEKAFNTAKSNMSELDKKWASAATSMQNLGNGMVKTGKKLTRNVTVPIVAAGAASVSLAKDYETNFAKVTTIVEANGDKTAGSMEKLKSEILKASSETGIAATSKHIRCNLCRPEGRRCRQGGHGCLETREGGLRRTGCRA